MPISANNHKVADPAVLRADLPGDDPTVLCACGHPRGQHDRVSARYCDATVSGGLDRGCVCHTVSGPYAGRM